MDEMSGESMGFIIWMMAGLCCCLLVIAVIAGVVYVIWKNAEKKPALQ